MMMPIETVGGDEQSLLHQRIDALTAAVAKLKGMLLNSRRLREVLHLGLSRRSGAGCGTIGATRRAETEVYR